MQFKIKDYQSLLKSVACFGRGVFSITMLEDNREKHAFKMYLYRNQGIFEQLKGTHGDIKILQLNRHGMQQFGGEIRNHRMILTWASLLDIALMNAYMVQVGEFQSYKTSPHTIVNILERRVGIISNRWGLTRKVVETDILLATKKSITNLLEDQEELAKLAKRESLSEEFLTEKISKAFTPKAFLTLR